MAKFLVMSKKISVASCRNCIIWIELLVQLVITS